MNDNEKYVVESMLVKLETANKRTWIALILALIFLVLSNCAWIYYESQWQYVSSETSFEAEQDGDENSISNIVFGDSYGSESQSQEENQN